MLEEMHADNRVYGTILQDRDGEIVKEGLAVDRLKTGDVVAVRFALDERGDRVARIIKLDVGAEPSPLDTGATPAPHPTEVRP